MCNTLVLQPGGQTLAAIDFTEIASATSGAERDEWELFVRELLEMVGFSIEVDPDRGADGGRDMVAVESRGGVAGTTEVRWLVSCKHKANSGESVKPTDELDILDRVRVHGCDAFLGAYSTIPSSGLATKLNSQDFGLETLVYDRARIERLLLSSPEGIALAKRYVPQSVRRWETENPEPARLFREAAELTCVVCGKDLLAADSKGLLQVVHPLRKAEESGDERIVAIYPACKGGCDYALVQKLKSEGYIASWIDVDDLKIPTLYVKQVAATIRRARDFDSAALEEMILALVKLFPYVSRHLTARERDRIGSLGDLPAYLGGLGFEDEG